MNYSLALALKIKYTTQSINRKMSVLKNINNVKRTVLQALTKNVGTSLSANGGKLNKADIKRVLIVRPNHRLGNQLLITPIVEDVTNFFPDAKIDLFVKGNVAPIIFQNYKNIDHILRLPKQHFKQLLQYIKGWLSIRKEYYDIVINVVPNSSSGRLLTKFARGKYKFYGDDVEELQQKYSDYQHIAKNPVYNFRYCLSKLGVSCDYNEIPSLNIKLSSSEIATGKELLDKLVTDKNKKTISIYTYATGAKCYDETWWLEFHKRLKSEYPNHNILEILPVENVSQILFKEPSLYSKDIREMAAVIANTEVFISADGGVMHLASAAQTPVIGLFSVTSIGRYEPYNGQSKGLNTNNLTNDEIISEINKNILA